MRTLMIPMAAVMMVATTSAVPALARNDNDWRDRAFASSSELTRSRDRLAYEQQQLQLAERFGDPREVREARRDVERAQREFERDRRDFQQVRGNSGNWGGNWGGDRGGDWGRDGYYATNAPVNGYAGYYDGGFDRRNVAYRPRPLEANDRIYRGTDNRYYCRRSDGTTGLVVGALGGGVLGNVIAPGGSKALGSIIGGSLGAIVGKSVDRGQTVCR